MAERKLSGPQQRCWTAYVGRSADRLFARQNRGARTARAFVVRQSARDEDGQLAKRGAYRLGSVSRAARECRVRRSFPEIRAHESSGLHGRMHERDFFLVKEGLRHAEETGARCDCASQANASAVETRPEQLAKPGKTLCAACDPVGALN